MKKSTKISLIIAVSLILVGSLIFIGAFAFLDFDIKKLSTDKYETNTHEITEAFDKISIDVPASEITFIPSDKNNCKVVCYDQEHLKHSAIVEDETLVIDTIDTRKWYHNIGVSFETMKLTVYLPKEEYTSLLVDTAVSNITLPKDFTFKNISINNSTGNIICYSTAKTLDLNTSTGKIQISDIECESINANSSTGKISFSNVIAKGKLSADASTGSITFTNSDAESISANTTTGSVTGNLLSSKVFVCDTSTGDIDVPKTTTGGICQISTSTGNIEINID